MVLTRFRSVKILKTVRNASFNNSIKHVSSTETFQPVKLSYASYESTVELVEAQAPPLMIMHGLFGSKGNWNSLCKVYQQKAVPERRIIAIDARNHGDSAHDDNHTYAHMAEDLRALLHQLHFEKVALMGHSMGGRTMMLFALKYPELVDRLVVADISPIGTSPQLNSTPALFQALENVKLPTEGSMSQARAFVDSQLSKIISDKGLRSFLLTNLVHRENGSYNWRINIPALVSCFNNIASFPVVDDMRFAGPVLFVGGGNSDYIQ